MFDIHQSVMGNDGDFDQECVANYIDGLAAEFEASPEAHPIVERYGRCEWTAMMLEFYLNYVGDSVPDMTLHDFEVVVFDLFPAKVSTSADSAQAIVDEVKAFWHFVHRQYGLNNARRIANSITTATAIDLGRALADPGNFGMAKTMIMAAKEAGYDVTNQDDLNEFVREYNRRLMESRPRMPMPAAPPSNNYESHHGLSSSRLNPRERDEKRRRSARAARKREQSR